MAEVKAVLAQAICDNTGEAASELVFRAGDVIRVIETDTGSVGWWRGELNGSTGYFPESFVTLFSEEEHARRATVLFDYDPENKDEDLCVKAGDVVEFWPVPSCPEWVDALLGDRRGYVPMAYIQPLVDGDSAAPGAVLTPPPPLGPASGAGSPPTSSSSDENKKAKEKEKKEAADKKQQKKKERPKTRPLSVVERKSAIGPPPFAASSSPSPSPAKSVSPAKTPVHIEPIYKIDASMKWVTGATQPQRISLKVGETKKDKTQKFTVYVIERPDGTQVLRRYKHFDWLHAHLHEQFPLLALPSPPEKQFSGRFDEQFIESRRRQLEVFLNYVVSHPVMGSCRTVQFFLEDTSETAEWKAAKAAVEKESKESGDKFLLLVAVETPSDAATAEATARFIKAAAIQEKHMFSLHEIDSSLGAKRESVATELEKEAAKWTSLQQEPCWVPNCGHCAPLSKTYSEFAGACAAEKDATLARVPYIGDASKHFGFLMAAFQDTARRLEQCEAQQQKRKADGKTSELQQEASGRAILLAEMAYIHTRLMQDMKDALLRQAIQERDLHKAAAEKWGAMVEQLTSSAK